MELTRIDSEKKQYMLEGFRRQRRNLVAMSLVVLCVELLGVEINKLNLLGNQVIINNQHMVHFALWVTLGYYLWRYYSYFHDLGDKGFRTSFSLRREKILKPFVIKHAMDCDEVRSKQEQSGVKAHPVEVFYFKDDALLKVSGRFKYRLGDNENLYGEKQVLDVVFEENGLALLVSSFRALLHVLLRTTYFSEYLLPFVFFLLALCFARDANVSWFMSFFA